MAAAGLGKLKPLNIRKIDGTFQSPVKVKVEDFNACPTYVGRYIRNVNNKAETPKWMKDRLNAIGLRSISPLVDITNYINYDMARPLHVFDADKLSGNVTVRMAQESEKFVSLEEKNMPWIAKPWGFAMTKVSNVWAELWAARKKGCSADTKNVFLECALFVPECIARTGRRFQIDSDSRYRYERWVDPKSNILGSDYAVQLITEICGGEVSEMMIEGAEDCAERVAYLRPSRMKDFIGLDISADKIIDILNKLGFKTSVEADGRIKAVSPTWRGDIEGEHDLVEEVVRMIGLDNIPAESLPHNQLPKQTLSPAQQRVVTVKHELAAKGMLETVTWSFTDSKLAEDYRRSDDVVLLMNPISAELDEMRPSLLPNLLMGAKNNIARGYGNVALFEVGPEFSGRKPGQQTLVAAGVRVGMTSKNTGREKPELMMYLTLRRMLWPLLPQQTVRLKMHR